MILVGIAVEVCISLIIARLKEIEENVIFLFQYKNRIKSTCNGLRFNDCIYIHSETDLNLKTNRDNDGIPFS